MLIAKKINPSKAFILILLLQTCLMIAKGYGKEFFHVDEALTFMLANSEYGIEIPEKYKNEWRPGSDYYDLLTVSTNNTFNYKQTYINQTNDVHPPLYYFLIHTASSFFPLQFSKWFGILPNIFFFLCTQIFLFLLSSSMLDSKFRALLPCMLYGFSLGAVSTVEFIRMYSMLTAILTIALYINYKIIHIPQKANQYLIILLSINTFGYLTHYYYIIYSFFLCAFMTIFLYTHSSYQHAIKYAAINILSLIIFILIYPASLFHIFSGYRGTEAFQNLAMTPFGDRLESFYQIINKQLFCSLLTFYIIFFVCYFVIRFLRQRKNKKAPMSARLAADKELVTEILETKNFHFILLLLCISIPSFLVIAKISAYTSFRYISALYPIFYILTSLFIFRVAHSSVFLKALSTILAIAILYSGVGLNHATSYRDNNETQSIIAKQKNLIITELSQNNAISPIIPRTHLYDNVYFLTKDNLKKLTDIINHHHAPYNNIGICILYSSITDFQQDIDTIINELNKHYTIKYKQNALMTCIKITALRQNN